MRAVVFIGPSLERVHSGRDTVVVRPPAVAGDVLKAVNEGFEVIGLVDAAFETCRTVTHDEILYALASGVRVFGAASMGAVRAVECSPFGMVGIGWVFEQYRDGVIEDDHEVAVLYGPAELGYPPLTTPMVEIRATLDAAVAERILTSEQASTVLQSASEAFYKSLRWSELIDELTDRSTAAALKDWLPENRVKIKELDARLLIERLTDLKWSPGPLTDVLFHRTLYWRAFCNEFGGEQKLTESEQSVLDELRLDPPLFSDLLDRAFARRGVTATEMPTEDCSRATLERFRAELGLVTSAEFNAWLAENDVEEAGIVPFLVRDDALSEKIAIELKDLLPDLLMELRIDGSYAALKRRAHKKASLVPQRDLTSMPAPFRDADLADLLAWFKEQRGFALADGNLDAAARELGLNSRMELHALLRLEFEFVSAEQLASDGH